jgi:recombination protein RecT
MADQSAALAGRRETGMQKVRNYMLSPEVKERFTDMMGPEAIYYLNQVLIIVANSEKLQECTPQSILIAAMRAASLKLSLDPGQGQAWIIPYAGVATYQTGYKGIYELAQRTNLYRFINVFEVYEGETLEENRMTGMHTLKGTRTGNKVLGYCLYFQLVTGFEKTFYMTIAEIENHAEHYSPGNYRNPKSAWNKDDRRERPKMMKKTVLSNGLRKWGRFNKSDLETLNSIENEQGFIDRGELPDESEVTSPITVTKTPEQINQDLGFDPETGEVKLEAAKPEPAAQPQPEKATQPDTAQAIKDAAAKLGGKPQARPATRPYDPETLKRQLEMKAESLRGQVANGQRNQVAACLDHVLGGDARRKELQMFLFGKASLKDAPDAFVVAMFQWLKPTYDQNQGVFLADEIAAKEAAAAHAYAQKHNGQQELPIQ